MRAADGRRGQAERALGAALEEIAQLGDDELVERLEVLWYVAWSETFLDRYDAALEHGRRGIELCRATGQDRLIVPLMLSSVFPLEMLGRIDDAREAGTAAVDAARLSGNHHHLSWALWEYGLTCWYGGDTGAAMVCIQEQDEQRAALHATELSGSPSRRTSSGPRSRKSSCQPPLPQTKPMTVGRAIPGRRLSGR